MVEDGRQNNEDHRLPLMGGMLAAQVLDCAREGFESFRGLVCRAPVVSPPVGCSVLRTVARNREDAIKNRSYGVRARVV
jgi:hypothetical protein